MMAGIMLASAWVTTRPQASTRCYTTVALWKRYGSEVKVGNMLSEGWRGGCAGRRCKGRQRRAAAPPLRDVSSSRMLPLPSHQPSEAEVRPDSLVCRGIIQHGGQQSDAMAKRFALAATSPRKKPLARMIVPHWHCAVVRQGSTSPMHMSVQSGGRRARQRLDPGLP